MESLGKNLQVTITNLEKIRDAHNNPPDSLFNQLDLLYDQQINLIDAAIQKSTPEYEIANVAMNEAAKKTSAAIADLAKTEAAINNIASAITKISDLIAKVS